MDNSLLESEKEAVAYFNKHGKEEVIRQINELYDTASKRMIEWHENNPNWFRAEGDSAIYFMTQEELALRHILLLGLTLCTDPAAEARARIMDRRGKQQAQRKLSKADQLFC